ncbi:hypothetical protein [uncultured Methanobrevibacter sp.]|uniref:hypothetical protein n=1 Tax=uncultured Methanobrevibacter sp. TaxID=253161 RepID=UPI0025FBDBBB|nr:hypothetical protein [uncultured Methanobrevibacter sp.]
MKYGFPPSNNILENQQTYSNFINLFNELNEKILKSIEKITSKNENLLNKLIIELKESFESLSNILREMKLYKDEYYDFFSIKRMAFYILDNKELLNQLPSIKTLMNLFYNLIQMKTKLDEENYLNEHKEFNMKLVSYEQYFYTKICKQSENYDEDTLSKITNTFIKL